MELKWVEDFLSVAEKGHFARAAEARHLTYSALSRRIKSLELWVGIELLDRTSHPIELTPAGQEFAAVAKEIVALAYVGRDRAVEYLRLSEKSVSIACLHTLALYFLPQLIAQLQREIGPIQTSIVAETRTIEEYLMSLQDGTADLFIGFRHPSKPFELDRDRFPEVSLGFEKMVAYYNPDLLEIDTSEDAASPIPYLAYSGTSFMSHVVAGILHRSPLSDRLHAVYWASLAESLCTGVQQGLGIAWLPESIAHQTQNRARLERVFEDCSAEFEIIAIRASSNNRPTVLDIWDRLENRDLRRQPPPPDLSPAPLVSAIPGP